MKVMKCKNVFELCVDFLTDLLGEKITTITDKDIWQLVEKLAIHQAKVDETLLKQGSPSTTAYLLVVGSVQGEVRYPNQALAKTFTVEAGSILGEIGLLTGLPHTATIQTGEDSQLLKLSRSAFITLLSLHPDIPNILADLAIQRQNDDATYLNYLKQLPELAPAAPNQEPASGLLAFCRRLLDSADHPLS